jgi:hypothetical protein
MIPATSSTLHVFLAGASAFGCFVAATFFLRFWRDTRDRLFVFFALAFAALALNRSLVTLHGVGHETQPFFYLIRLGAFVLIAYAVIDKNRRQA